MFSTEMIPVYTETSVCTGGVVVTANVDDGSVDRNARGHFFGKERPEGDIESLYRWGIITDSKNNVFVSGIVVDCPDTDAVKTVFRIEGSVPHTVVEMRISDTVVLEKDGAAVRVVPCLSHGVIEVRWTTENEHGEDIISLLNSRTFRYVSAVSSCELVPPEEMSKQAAHAVNILCLDAKEMAAAMMAAVPLMSVTMAAMFYKELRPVNGYTDPRCRWAVEVARRFRDEQSAHIDGIMGNYPDDALYATAFAKHMCCEHKALVQSFSDVCEHIVHLYWGWTP